MLAASYFFRWFIQKMADIDVISLNSLTELNDAMMSGYEFFRYKETTRYGGQYKHAQWVHVHQFTIILRFMKDIEIP